MKKIVKRGTYKDMAYKIEQELGWEGVSIVIVNTEETENEDYVEVEYYLIF
jgi:hypothetical protein